MTIAMRTGTGPASAISTRGLTKRYGAIEALVDLDLEVPSGSVFGFLGPNGAGKTTTLKILAGLTHQTSGQAFVGGVAVTAEGAHRRVLGYLAQDPRFYDWMTGRETLEYVASFYPEVADPRRRADELLSLVGLTAAAGRRTKTYSGGMRQRLGIAQALVGRPAVLMLDEPAASLDPLGRRDVLELLDSLREEATVLYSTHILEDVQRIADHVAILDHGRLIRTAATRDLLESFSRDLLRVTLGRADATTGRQLAQLPGVGPVREVASDERSRSFELTVADGQVEAAQAAVTRLAADRGLVVVANAPETLDLESVFMRLVDQKEVAA